MGAGRTDLETQGIDWCVKVVGRDWMSVAAQRKEGNGKELFSFCNSLKPSFNASAVVLRYRASQPWRCPETQRLPNPLLRLLLA